MSDTKRVNPNTFKEEKERRHIHRKWKSKKHKEEFYRRVYEGDEPTEQELNEYFVD